METDPNSLDPELRTAKFTSITSASLGLMSLCLAIIPVCGGAVSLLGILLGYSSLRVEHTTTAVVGVVLSGLGLLIVIVYALFLYIF
jgi:hypothetical protein